MDFDDWLLKLGAYNEKWKLEKRIEFWNEVLNLKFMSRWKPAVKYVELANGIVIDTGYGYKAIRKDGETFWIEKSKPYCIEQVDEFLNEVKL